MRYKEAPLHLPKMMKPRVVELKVCIHSYIWSYEELPQLITNIEASHALVCKIMDVVLYAHKIPSIGTLTLEKTKARAWLELDSYFH